MKAGPKSQNTVAKTPRVSALMNAMGGLCAWQKASKRTASALETSVKTTTCIWRQPTKIKNAERQGAHWAQSRVARPSCSNSERRSVPQLRERPPLFTGQIPAQTSSVVFRAVRASKPERKASVTGSVDAVTATAGLSSCSLATDAAARFCPISASER